MKLKNLSLLIIPFILIGCSSGIKPLSKKQLSGASYSGKVELKTNEYVFQDVPVIIQAKTNTVKVDLSKYLEPYHTNANKKLDVTGKVETLELKIISQPVTNIIRVPVKPASFLSNEFLLFYYGTLLIVIGGAYYILKLIKRKNQPKKTEKEVENITKPV